MAKIQWGTTKLFGRDISNEDITGLGLTTLGSLGQGINLIERQYQEDNALNPVLAPTVSGNTWEEVLNGNELNEGLRNIQSSQVDYSNNLNNTNLYNSWDSNDIQSEVQYNQTGPWGAMLEDAGKFGAAGAMLGPLGAIIAPGIGALSGFLRSAISDRQHSRNARLQNQQVNRVNNQQIDNFYDTALSNQQRDIRNNMRNYFAEGGEMGLNGIQKIMTGGSHEQNPYGGQTVGYASDGLPNKVEEGEVIYDDYVYSARLKASKSLLDKYNLPVKYAGKTFACVADKLQEESEERPNDPISISTLKDLMGRLRDAQEEHKAKIEKRRLAKEFDSLPTEAKAQLATQVMQPMAAPQNDLGMSQLSMQQPTLPENEPLGVQEPSLGMEQMMAEGGKIHIKPSKRGTFTAAAKKRGMGVQEFASKVLTNKENYSSAMVKKANFARNAAHWGADGLDLNNPDDFINAPWRVGPKVTTVMTPPAPLAVPMRWSDVNRPANWFDRLYFDQGAFDNVTLQDPSTYTNIFDENGKYLPDYRSAVEQLDQRTYDWMKANIPGFKDTRAWDSKKNDWVPLSQIKHWGIDDNENTKENARLVDTIHRAFNSMMIRPEANTDTTLTFVGAESPYFNSNNYVSSTASSSSSSTSTGKDTFRLGRVAEWPRYAPAVGSGIGALTSSIQGPDYTYANELRDIAGQYNPISAPSLGGWRRYNPYDVNLSNNEAMAQLASAMRANVASGNRATQAAGLIGLENAYARENAARNLQWQQANEANRLATDQYNLGIDQINLGTVQQYDTLNQQIEGNRLGMLAAAAWAKDDSDTAWAQNILTNTTNFLNNLGDLGKDNWSRNQRNALLKEFGMEGLARILGLTV